MTVALRSFTRHNKFMSKFTTTDSTSIIKPGVTLRPNDDSIGQLQSDREAAQELFRKRLTLHLSQLLLNILVHVVSSQKLLAKALSCVAGQQLTCSFPR